VLELSIVIAALIVFGLLLSMFTSTPKAGG
jgi:hypothetical protein